MPPWEKYQKPDYSNPEVVNAAITDLYSEDGPWAKYQKPQEVAPQQIIPNEPVGTVEDTAKAIGSNLVGGGIDTAMILPNMINAAVAGPQMLGRGIADTISPMLGAEPQPRGELWQPFYGSGDVEKAIGTDYQPETTSGKVAALPARIAGGLLGAKGIDSQRGNVDKLLNNQSGVKQPKAPKANADDIKVLAQEQYAIKEQQGGVLKPNVSDKFVKELDGLSKQTAIGKELAGDSIFTDTVNRLKTVLSGKPITLKAADEVDDFLSDRISETYLTNPAQSQKLRQIKETFRKTIDPETLADTDIVGGKAGLQAWREGDKLWQAQSKLREIEKIVTRANMTDNPATAMKTGFRNLYMNAKKSRGFDKEEMKLLEKAALSGASSEILRGLGSRLNSIISLGSGGGLGQTAALAGASMISRGGATALQAGRADKLSSMIANKAIPQQSTPLPANANIQGAYSPVMSPASVAPMLTLEQIMQLPPAEAKKLLQKVK